MTSMGGPGPIDPGGEGTRQYAKGYTAELDPNAEHGHRPKRRASLRHPPLEMKIIGGAGLAIVAGVVLLQFT